LQLSPSADEGVAKLEGPTNAEVTEHSLLEQSQAMRCLNQRIAHQRSLVMKCLEASPSSKDELNRQIAALQELQRQQIELEVSLLERERSRSGAGGGERSIAGSFAETISGSDNCDRLSRNSEPASLRYKDEERGAVTELEATIGSCSSRTRARSRLSIEDDESQRSRRILLKPPPSRGYSSVYLTVRRSVSIATYTSLLPNSLSTLGDSLSKILGIAKRLYL
jgi:kinesin family protein 16B